MIIFLLVFLIINIFLLKKIDKKKISYVILIISNLITSSSIILFYSSQLLLSKPLRFFLENNATINYDWIFDYNILYTYIIVSILVFNGFYFFNLKFLDNLNLKFNFIFNLNNSLIKKKHLRYLIIIHILILYYSYFGFDLISFNISKDNHLLNLISHILLFIIIRNFFIEKKLYFFIFYISFVLLVDSYFSQSRISILILSLFFFQILFLKLDKRKFISILIIILIFLLIPIFVYTISLLRNYINLNPNNLNIIQNFLSLFIRFDWAHELSNLFENNIKFIYFNDFDYFLSQIIPNFIDNNSLEWRDYIREDIDVALYGHESMYIDNQIITTTHTYNPFVDSYYRFGGNFYLYFAIYAIIASFFIKIYNLDKTNFFIILNFFNLTIFDKSLYYMIQQNIYFVSVFVICILTINLYEKYSIKKHNL